jgi:hypothetical protein
MDSTDKAELITRVYHWLYAQAQEYGHKDHHDRWVVQITLGFGGIGKRLEMSRSALIQIFETLKIEGVIIVRDGLYFKLNGHYMASYQYAGEYVSNQFLESLSEDDKHKFMPLDELSDVLTRITRRQYERNLTEGMTPADSQKQATMVFGLWLEDHRRFCRYNDSRSKL